MTIEDAKYILQETFNAQGIGEVEIQQTSIYIHVGLKVGTVERYDGEMIEVWVGAAYTKDDPEIYWMMGTCIPNDKMYWWEHCAIRVKKNSKADDSAVDSADKIASELVGKAKQELEKFDREREDKKGRFLSNTDLNPDYKFSPRTLQVDVVRASSGRKREIEPQRMEDLVAAYKRSSAKGGGSSTNRIAWEDGKEVLQWVNPDTHRWETIPLDTSTHVVEFDDAVIELEFTRGQWRSLTPEEQKAEGYRDYRVHRVLIPEQVAKHMFHRLFKYGETKDLYFVLHNSNVRVDFFIGNDRYFEPLANWIGKNRSYLAQLHKKYD